MGLGSQGDLGNRYSGGGIERIDFGAMIDTLQILPHRTKKGSIAPCSRSCLQNSRGCCRARECVRHDGIGGDLRTKMHYQVRRDLTVKAAGAETKCGEPDAAALTLSSLIRSCYG